jgi:hypothetical protein
MKLYWDIDNDRMVSGMNSPVAITDLTMVLRDIVAIELNVVRVATAGTTYYELADLPVGRTPYFGAKPAAALSGTHLVAQPNWTHGSTGIYTANIYLGQDNLIAAVGAASPLTLVAEFVQISETGDNYNSTQFPLIVKADVTQGGESTNSGVYAACLVVQVVEDGKKVILIQNTDGVVYQRLTAPGA